MIVEYFFFTSPEGQPPYIASASVIIFSWDYIRNFVFSCKFNIIHELQFLFYIEYTPKILQKIFILMVPPPHIHKSGAKPQFAYYVKYLNVK